MITKIRKKKRANKRQANGQTKGKQRATNNNDNNDNNITNIKKERKSKNSFDFIINNYSENETLKNELKNHLAVRKLKKGALTDRAIELELNSLDKIANNDKDKIAIVRQSIERGWISFYPIKEINRKETDEEKLERLRKEFEQ